MRRSGDTTSGPITLRGVAGAATLPVLTFSANTIGVSGSNVYYLVFKDFRFTNSNATKTVSEGFRFPTGLVSLSGLKIDGFWKGITSNATTGICIVKDCEIIYTNIKNITKTKNVGGVNAINLKRIYI
jgi:hypothetical protein